jgi:hypothetical protein
MNAKTSHEEATFLLAPEQNMRGEGGAYIMLLVRNEVLVCNVIHYVPVLLPNHYL